MSAVVSSKINTLRCMFSPLNTCTGFSEDVFYLEVAIVTVIAVKKTDHNDPGLGWHHSDVGPV